MYEEPEVNPDLIPEAQEAIRQYVLTAGEVAHILGVTQQAVNLWTQAKQIDVLTEKGEDRKISKNRYNLQGVVDVAAAKGRTVRLWAIPLRLLTQYDATPLQQLPPELLEPTPPADTPPEWIPEAEAARILEKSRGTLRNHRLAGYLNPKLHIRENPSPAAPGVQYSGHDLQLVVAGKLDLYMDAPKEVQA